MGNDDGTKDPTSGEADRQAATRQLASEIEALRASIGEEVTTRRLVVRDGEGPSVVMTADHSRATIEISAGDRRPPVAISLTASVEDAEAFASVALATNGNTVAELLVVAPLDASESTCRLVFDSPTDQQGWLVIDIHGVRTEPASD